MKTRATKMEKLRAARCDREQHFRLIRGLTLDHNLRRFQAYVKKLTKHPDVVAIAARVRAKRRAHAMLAAAGGCVVA
jgi:hypothetical protein